MRVDVTKAQDAYADWMKDQRVFRVEITDQSETSLNGFAVPFGIVWAVDLPPEVFDHDARLRAWLTRPDGTTRPMSIWTTSEAEGSSQIILGRYPAPGDTVTIRW